MGDAVFTGWVGGAKPFDDDLELMLGLGGEGGHCLFEVSGDSLCSERFSEGAEKFDSVRRSSDGERGVLRVAGHEFINERRVFAGGGGIW